MAIELRPYQKQAIENIIAELTAHRSTLLLLATGTGKTVTFSALAARAAAKGKHTLVLAHRRELLEQAAATMQRFGLGTGIECASDMVDVAALPNVVLATVQSLRGNRLRRFPANVFSFVVVDEAHHAVAQSYRNVLGYFTSAKVLGVTATPDRADGAALRQVFESVAYRMDIADGIKGNWLSPIALHSVSVDALDLSRVRTVAGELDRSELEAELVRDEVLHQVARPLAELPQGRKTIAFVAGVEQAYALAEVLRGYGVTAAAVDGAMSPEQRAQIRALYADGRVQVVCNAMLWCEGFDEPSTSCIALVRPTRSRSLLCQMIGRGTRLAEGKRECLVLDFVPARAAQIRLASPADALAGRELSDDVAAAVRKASATTAGNALELVRKAEDDAAAAAQASELAKREARHVLQVDAVYHTARLPLDVLLDVANDNAPVAPWASERATPRQIDTLLNAGFKVDTSITAGQANYLFEILKQRRAAGLCTIKQAKRLRSYGLRDDLGFDDARRAMDAIAGNGWRPPLWLRQQYGAV